MQFFKKPVFSFSVLIIILTLPIYISLIRPGFFPMQDDLQAFRVQQLVKCVVDLQIPCRWIPDMGYQYGYPQFNFYPPSVFYLGALIHFLGFQIIDAVKILFILGSVLSSLTMYLFLKTFFNHLDAKITNRNNFAAFVGSMLYSYVPYKAAEMYVRGSLSEFWAFVFFPLIFWAILQLIQTAKIKYIAWVGLSVGGLLITHNLMSFIFLPIAAIWTAVLVVVYKKWKTIPKLIIGFGLGLGLAAFFTIPVLQEGQYVHLETLTSGYFDYRQHFVDLYEMFVSNHFGYGSSVLGPNDDLTLSVGIVHWILALLATIFCVVKFKQHKRIAIIVFTLSLVELGVMFLMHQKSSFIWAEIPPLKFLQFPWRFLSDSAFILSFLGSCFIYLIWDLKKKYSLVIGILVIILIIILHGAFFKPKSWLNITDADKFSGALWEKELTISIFDYLPIYAKFPPAHKAPDYPEVLQGEAFFGSYKKGSDYQVGTLAASRDAQIRLPLFDFPGMRVTVDGNIVYHTHEDCRNEDFCLGLITFSVPEGNHTFKAELTDTPVREVSNIITIISLLFTASLFFLIKE